MLQRPRNVLKTYLWQKMDMKLCIVCVLYLYYTFCYKTLKAWVYSSYFVILHAVFSWPIAVKQSLGIRESSTC